MSFWADSKPSMRKIWSQLIFRRPAVPGWAALVAGGKARGWAFRLTHEHDGFALESSGGANPWRLEWGPSQRRYLGAHELRLRAETGIDPMTHGVLMPRGLLTALEQEIYQQFTEGVMTRLDEQTPEEVRWLAMSERLKASEMGPLTEQFAAVSNVADWMAEWLQTGLAPALLTWAGEGAGHSTQARPATTPVPMSLVMRRGQLVLRLSMPKPDLALVTAAVALYEVALSEARRWSEAPPA
jgi:hypothetical protein